MRMTGRGTRPAPNLSARILPIVLVAGGALAFAQFCIDNSVSNIICSVVTVLMAAITFGYCLRPGTIQRFPLSTVAILGYNVTSMTLALIAQTSNLQPLTFNLQVPVQTFRLSAVLQLVLIAAHAVYAYSPLLYRIRAFLSWRILRPIGIFRMPTNTELWMLGIFGLASIWYSRIIYAGDIDYGDAGGRFLQALRPYAAAPFLIPLRAAFTLTPVRAGGTRTYAMLGVYFLVIVATGVSDNSRSTFATVALTFLLGVVLAIALRRIQVTQRARYLLIASLVVGMPLISIAQDLANAMVIARSSKTGMSISNIVSATAEAYSSKAGLEKAAQAAIVMSGSSYSEYYIRSPFLQRLTYTKYTDIVANASNRLGEMQILQIRHEFWMQTASMLPTPVLRMLNIPVDKEDTAHSGGDFYDNLAFGTTNSAYRLGSSIVNSKDVLGIWWIPGMFCIFILAILTIDIFSLPTKMGVILSPLAFLSLYLWFTRELVADSLAQQLGVFLRGTVQSIVIFLVMANIARLGTSLLTPPRRAVSRVTARSS